MPLQAVNKSNHEIIASIIRRYLDRVREIWRLKASLVRRKHDHFQDLYLRHFTKRAMFNRKFETQKTSFLTICYLS